MNWPIVDPLDDGIRPAGEPDQCFYCRQKVGQPHGPECVIVTKRVKVRHTIEVEVDVPHYWDNEQIDFHYNGSSWCASNIVDHLQELIDGGDCLCNRAETVVGDVVDDTPRRKLQTTTPEVQRHGDDA